MAVLLAMMKPEKGIEPNAPHSHRQINSLSPSLG